MTAMTNDDGHENNDDMVRFFNGEGECLDVYQGKVHPRTLLRHTEVSAVLQIAHLHGK